MNKWSHTRCSQLFSVNKNKRGVLGSFTVTFVATVIIVVLLLVFVFLSSTVEIFSNQNAGETIFKEDSLGLTDGVGYMENYKKLTEARFLVNSETSLDDALVEVDYEK